MQFTHQWFLVTLKYLSLEIDVTPKVHAVMYHVSEFCELKGMGLAPWSEQTSESVHHDFNLLWEKYKLKDIQHIDYKCDFFKMFIYT